MLVPLEKPSRGIKFGDSPKGVQLRKVAREVDRRSREFFAAIKSIREAYALYKRAKQLFPSMTIDINSSFMNQLSDLEEFCDPGFEKALDENGIFEDV